MKIEKVYKTSRGVFWNRSDAEKRSNRAKVYSYGISDPELEAVLESFVLVDGDHVFSLLEVEVK